MNLARHPGALAAPARALLACSSRRGSTRRAVTVACQAVRERDFRLIADRSLDLSVQGMLVPMGLPVEQGESVIVSFEVPGTWIDVEATVSRIVHGRRPNDGEPAVGLAFGAMSPASRAALAGFLHGRPPPLPRRGPFARLRRGAPAPQLADHLLMVHGPLSRPVLAPSSGGDALAEEETMARGDVELVEEAPVDAFGLGVLREMAAAWRRLATTD